LLDGVRIGGLAVRNALCPLAAVRHIGHRFAASTRRDWLHLAGVCRQLRGLAAEICLDRIVSRHQFAPFDRALVAYCATMICAFGIDGACRCSLQRTRPCSSNPALRSVKFFGFGIRTGRRGGLPSALRRPRPHPACRSSSPLRFASAAAFASASSSGLGAWRILSARRCLCDPVRQLLRRSFVATVQLVPLHFSVPPPRPPVLSHLATRLQFPRHPPSGLLIALCFDAFAFDSWYQPSSATCPSFTGRPSAQSKTA